MIQRLGLSGVGRIGGSLARALRHRGLVGEIIGIDADPSNLAIAKKQRLVDHVSPSIAAAVTGADWVVIATPVGAMLTIFSALRPSWRDDVVYTDTGSTKLDVIAALERIFGAVPANFVPGHPIAGAERSGAVAAHAGLFENRRVILTPLTNTDPHILENPYKWR